MVAVRIVAYEPAPDNFDLGCWTLEVPALSGTVHAVNPDITVDGSRYVNKTVQGNLYLDYVDIEETPAALPSFTTELRPGLFGDRVNLTGTFVRHARSEEDAECYVVRSLIEIEALLDPPTRVPKEVVPGSFLRVRGTLTFRLAAVQ